MSDTELLLAAQLGCLTGLAWLALAMDVHWRQVRGHRPLTGSRQLGLRVLGAAALGVALLLCLKVNHPSMAALVWIMMLTVGALSLAFTLAWKPRWLKLLVIWLR